MANTVTNKTLFDGNNKIIVLVDILGDGTPAELSNEVIVDLSSLTGPDGVNPPERLKVQKLCWELDTDVNATLEFDRTSNVLIANMHSEDGDLDLWNTGGIPDTGSGSTGDIILSTNGQVQDGILRFYLEVTKHGNTAP